MPSRKWIATALIGVASIALGLIYSFHSLSHEATPFQDEKWFAGRNLIKEQIDPGCVLGGMALDLQTSKHLDRLTQQQVISKIGPPDGAEGAAFAWNLGQCHGWGWDNSRLLVKLNASGLVSEIRLVKADF
jgi:hypothetical protein